MSDELYINDNSDSIFKLLKETTTLNGAQICGFLGNIRYETTTFNPQAVGDNGKAYGICQWRDGRRTNLRNLYGEPSTLEQQVAFIWWELHTPDWPDGGRSGSYTKYISKVTGTRDGAYLAGDYISRHFESPADTEYEAARRAAMAQGYWDYYIEHKAADAIVIANPSTHAPIPGDPTGNYTGPHVNHNIPDYTALASVDPYADIMKENLSRVSEAGFDYGYLIDMTNSDNREFKFYIPDFSEAAGANWSNIDIPGRSVSIKSYSSTNSRTITINLELFAGEGLYKSGTDVVGQMHADANFIKSLEYPDYSTGITRPPATVQLILGSVVNIAGVVSGVTVEHLRPRDSQNRSMYLKVSFTVTQTAFDPPGFSDIRNAPTRSSSVPAPVDVAPIIIPGIGNDPGVIPGIGNDTPPSGGNGDPLTS